MFEMPGGLRRPASADTAAVEPDDAGPLAMPRPTASADQRERRTRRTPTTPRRTPAPRSRRSPGANPSADRPRRRRSCAASGVIAGVIAIIAGGRGQRRQPRLERAHPERGRVLEVQAEHVHQRVDRARDDQDRQRRADEHAVAQQLRGRRAAPRPAARPRRTARATTIETAKQPSVAADAQPQSLPLLSASTTGASTSATSTVPGPVDRARAVRVARLLRRCASVSGTHAAAIAGVDPEQALPAGGVDEHAADAAARARRPPPTPRPTA